jgi:hypothetical protein
VDLDGRFKMVANMYRPFSVRALGDPRLLVDMFAINFLIANFRPLAYQARKHSPWGIYRDCFLSPGSLLASPRAAWREKKEQKDGANTFM